MYDYNLTTRHARSIAAQVQPDGTITAAGHRTLIAECVLPAVESPGPITLEDALRIAGMTASDFLSSLPTTKTGEGLSKLVHDYAEACVRERVAELVADDARTIREAIAGSRHLSRTTRGDNAFTELEKLERAAEEARAEAAAALSKLSQVSPLFSYAVCRKLALLRIRDRLLPNSRSTMLNAEPGRMRRFHELRVMAMLTMVPSE